MIIHQGRYCYYLYCTDEETEPQKDLVTYQRTHSLACMVRPFKTAALLRSVHPPLNLALLHSHEYPILLIIGLN